MRCRGARTAQMVATMVTTVQDLYAGSGAQRICCYLQHGRVRRGAARRPGWRGSDLTSSSGTRDFCVVSCEGFGQTLQWRISVRALVSGLIVSPHRAQGGYHLDRGSSRAMTSVLHDAGIGDDRGYLVDRRHRDGPTGGRRGGSMAQVELRAPTAISTSDPLRCASWTARIRSSWAPSTRATAR